jgi:uncharacterized protein (DUF1778 family)
MPKRTPTGRGRGRPRLPDEQKLSPKIDVRFRDDQRELIAQAAQKVGERDSVFVREAALARANRVLERER